MLVGGRPRRATGRVLTEQAAKEKEQRRRRRRYWSQQSTRVAVDEEEDDGGVQCFRLLDDCATWGLDDWRTRTRAGSAPVLRFDRLVRPTGIGT